MKKLIAYAAIACAAAMPASAGPLADATADMLWGVEISGYLELGSTYNFEDPWTDTNQYRIFDTDEGDLIDFNAFNLVIDKSPEDIDEVGFRLDMIYGEDAAVIGGGDGVLDDGDFNLYQAYISYIAPIGNGLTIDAGRFATWHGYEVIEGPANDQYSRSFLFGLAIPFTHTGFRATYTINEMWEASAGITQGWDTVEDNNDSPTGHFALRFMPMETIYSQVSVAYGPEMPANNSDNTLLVDFVATWQATEQFLLGLNFDYAVAEDLGVGGSDAEWWGFAGYGRYDLTDKLYLALRGEWMEDEDNSRFGAVLNPGETGLEVWEVTFTVGYELVEGLDTRLEYRHDDADSDIFVGEDPGTFEDSQDTIAFEIVYSF